MKGLIFLLFIAFFPICIHAQGGTQQSLYDKAESMFNHGYFESAEEVLLSHMGSFKGMHKSSALRLVAICELERGRLDVAREYTEKLLKNDPYYTPTINDPQRFVDMVNEIKSQDAGITTASRQSESVDEAPVPVTVITEDMIRHSGASTLQDLLCLYVPGMSYAEGIESNIAMHGISGLSQEMILFLQDGHRMNSSSTNAEAPDYRNSLDKIQQIEVLRGPASSLYGNVALTAVVNIITYKGAKLDGGRISGTLGTQHTYGGSFVVGGGNNVVDITGWGSVNASQGFRHTIENDITGGVTTLYAHGFNKRPSYDVGIKGRWGDFTMTVNSNRSKQVPYFNFMQISADKTLSIGQSFQPVIQPMGNDYNFIKNYNYDRYPTLNSNGPGITRTNHRVNLDYTHSFGNLDFQASGYVSMESSCLYNVLGDSVNENMALALLNKAGLVDDQTLAMLMIDKTSNLYSMIRPYINTNGTYEGIIWENLSFGGQAQVMTKYNFLGTGNASFGIQYDHFVLTDGTLYIGGNYNTNSTMSLGDIFSNGKENIISGYAQIKHYFLPQLILNAGLRFDHKRQFNHSELDKLSPRASLIYKFGSGLSLRTSYNYSFVDAPFLYRACKISLFSGGEALKPQTMKSLQTSVAYTQPDTHFSAEISGYYNIASDILTQSSNFSTSSYSFTSSGKMKQFVVEAAGQYLLPRLMLNANATWQRVVEAKTECNVHHGNRLGIPGLMGNLALAWAPYVGKGSDFFKGGKLWLNGSLSVQGRTYYQKVDMLTSSTDVSNHVILGVHPQLILRIGATYEWKYLDISLNVKNLTNNQYMVGSNMLDGVPYAGRQLLCKLTVKF